MKIKYLLIVFLFIPANLLRSQNTNYIMRYSGNAEGEYTGNKTFMLQRAAGTCPSLTARLYYPKTNEVLLHTKQYTHNRSITLDCPTCYQVHQTDLDDFYGNSRRIFTITNPVDYLEFELTCTGHNDVDLPEYFNPIDLFPLNTSSLSGDITQYLSASDDIQSGNAGIVSAVNSIINNCSDCNTLRKVIEELEKFIFLNITYDTVYPMDAISTYNRNTGNCTGYSNLMVAFLRCLGIPARVTGGTSVGSQYSLPITGFIPPTIPRGTGIIGPHAQFEVYYPSLNNWVQGEPQSDMHWIDHNFIKQSHTLDFALAGLNEFEYDESCPDYTFTTNDLTTMTSLNNNLSYIRYDPFYGTSGSGNIITAVNDRPIIVTGDGDIVEIVEPPVGFVFDVGDEPTFHAEFESYYGNTWVETWDWKIELIYPEGTYNYVQKTGIIDWPVYYYWETETPTNIPCYNWARDMNNNILGKVKVTAYLNDGDIVGDELDIRINDDGNTYIQNYTIRTGSETISGKNIIVGSNVDPNKAIGPVNLYGGSLTIDACDQIEIVNDFNAAYGATLEIK